MTQPSTPSWWSAERGDDFQRFREDLRAYLQRNGLSARDAVSRLETDFPAHRVRDINPALLRRDRMEDWFEHGRWDPVVLYAFCDEFSYSLWDAAFALRTLPEDPSVWLGERMRAGTLLSVERYLEDKYRIQLAARQDPEKDPVARTARQVEDLLRRDDVRNRAGRWRMRRDPYERGNAAPIPFHTYLIFEPEPEPEPEDPPVSAFERGLALRREVDHELDKLRRDRVYTHWEHARELTSGSADCQALIVESHFDNKPSLLDNEAELQDWAAVTPVVLLGVYYSGVKDVAVEVAGATKLGALDVSRYIAEEIRDTRPFRRELILQSQVFWNLISADLGRRLVVTIDDYEALAPRSDDPDRPALGWPAQHRDRRQPWRPQPYPGTAVVLEMGPDLLEYAAYRIVTAQIHDRVIAEPRREELRELVSRERSELLAAQQRLNRLADRFEHRYRLAPLTVPDAKIRLGNELEGTPDDDGYGYGDQVHEMFDAYRATARVVADELIHRKDAGPRGRRPR